MSTEHPRRDRSTECIKGVTWADSRPAVSPSISTLSLDGLQKRVTEAESNTKKLVERLAELGFSSEVRTNAELAQQQRRPVVPFRAATDTVQTVNTKLFEISNRLQANEVSLKTLQLTVEKIQLQQTAILQRNGRPKSARATFSDESKRLSKDLAKSRRDLRQMKETQQDSHDVVRKLTSALDIATSNKMALVTRMEEFKGAKQKAVNRMSEVKAKLAYENARKIELEETQAALLSQVKEMDVVVDRARGEVRTLSQDCTVLRKEVIRAREELGNEQQKRLNAETTIHQLNDELASRKLKVTSLFEQNKSQSAQIQNVSKLLKKAQDRYGRSQEELLQSNSELQAARDRIAEMQQQLLACESEKNRLNVINQESIKSEQERSHAVMKQREEELGRALDGAREKNVELSTMLSQARDKGTEAVGLLKEIRQQLAMEREKFGQSVAEMEETVAGLRGQLADGVAEKQQLLADKEKLLDEINQAVDSMTAERQILSSQVQDLQSRLVAADTELARLREALNALELAKSSVESQLMDCSKGENLKAELKAVELSRDRSQRELERMQTKLHKVESDKAKSVLQVGQMERNLCACQEDNTRLVESLEAVTASNNELQEVLKSTKTELVKESRKARALSDAKATWDATLQQLQGEVNHLQGQIVALEGNASSTESSMVIQLETAVAHYKAENSKLLEAAAQARAELRHCTTRNEDLEQAWKTTKDICKDVGKERDHLRQDLLEASRRFNSSQSQHSAEVESLRKENKELTGQLQELNSRHNTLEVIKQQLQSNVSSSERQVSKLRREVLALKGQLANSRRSQEKAEKQLQITKSEGMSATKLNQDDPVKLRKDLELLAEAQLNSEQTMRRQRDELQRMKAAKAMIERQYEELAAKMEKELTELKSASEQQISDAMERSLQASAQLEEAEVSHRARLNQINSELDRARRSHHSLTLQTKTQGEELKRVQLKAQEQTSRAQQAVQLCRLTVSKLASQAEIDQESASGALARMRTQLSLERELASSSAVKYEHLKMSSTRRCRELAEEVAHLKRLRSPRDTNTPYDTSTN